MNTETTPDRIAHGRAMLNTIEAHCDLWEATLYYDTHPQYYLAIKTLRRMYDESELDYATGLITDPHPRQIGDRILPRWEWFLHRIAVRLGLGGAEE